MFFPEGQIHVFVYGWPVSMRLKRPGSYVVLEYVRSLIKRKDTQARWCPPHRSA